MDVALPLAQTQHEVTFGFAVSPSSITLLIVFFLVNFVLAVAVAVAVAVALAVEGHAEGWWDGLGMSVCGISGLPCTIFSLV